MKRQTKEPKTAVGRRPESNSHLPAEVEKEFCSDYERILKQSDRYRQFLRWEDCACDSRNSGGAVANKNDRQSGEPGA